MSIAAISGTSQVAQSQYSESSTEVSEKTKNKDFAEISKIVNEGGVLSETEFQRLLADMKKLGEEVNLSADEQDLLTRFMDLAKQVNEAVNNGQNPANIYITANGDDIVDQWSVFVTQKKQESTFQKKELLTGNAVIDSFSSVQMLTLYGNALMINMSNETASTLTVMQKLFEKVTVALSELQSFLSKINAFYKEALVDRQEKGKKIEKDKPEEAAGLQNGQLVDWNKEGLGPYQEKSGYVYPPSDNAQKDLSMAIQYQTIVSMSKSSSPYGRLFGGTLSLNGQPAKNISDLPDYNEEVGKVELNPDGSTMYFNEDMVPDSVRQYTTKITLDGQDYYAITPKVMDDVLQEVSMLLSMVLPKEGASAAGSFYDLNKSNILNNVTLDTLISNCNNKMKSVSDLATKMNEQMRQLQNAIDSSRQQFDSAQSMFAQQQNKMG